MFPIKLNQSLPLYNSSGGSCTEKFQKQSNYHHHFLRRIRLAFWRRPKLCLLAGALCLGLFYLLLEALTGHSAMTSSASSYSSSFLNSHQHHQQFDSNLASLSVSSRCAPMSANTAAAYTAFVKALLRTLDMLQVGHFLCYDSLWRVLRHQNGEGGGGNGGGQQKKVETFSKQQQQLNTAQTSARPLHLKLRLADGCLNLCILNEELMRHEEALVERRFRNAGITVRYQHGDGLYLMTPTTRIFREAEGGGDESGGGDLHPELFTLHARVHVFERDPLIDEYRRVGWKARVLPSTMCNQLHCFPPTLVEQPLPKVQLLPGVLVNVPREGVEMQKYHYPDNWWKLGINGAGDCGD